MQHHSYERNSIGRLDFSTLASINDMNGRSLLNKGIQLHGAGNRDPIFFLHLTSWTLGPRSGEFVYLGAEHREDRDTSRHLLKRNIEGTRI